MKIKGKCSCNENYGGNDCSIKLSEPPALNSTAYAQSNNTCDRTKSSCNLIPIFGFNFSFSIQMTVRYTVSFVCYKLNFII